MSDINEQTMVKAVQFKDGELLTPISWDYSAGDNIFFTRLFKKGAKIGDTATEYFYVMCDGQEFVKFVLLAHDDELKNGTLLAPGSVEIEQIEDYLKEHPLDKYFKVLGIVKIPFTKGTTEDEYTVVMTLKEDGIEVKNTNGRTNEVATTFWAFKDIPLSEAKGEAFAALKAKDEPKPVDNDNYGPLPCNISHVTDKNDNAILQRLFNKGAPVGTIAKIEISAIFDGVVAYDYMGILHDDSFKIDEPPIPGYSNFYDAAKLEEAVKKQRPNDYFENPKEPLMIRLPENAYRGDKFDVTLTYKGNGIDILVINTRTNAKKEGFWPLDFSNVNMNTNVKQEGPAKLPDSAKGAQRDISTVRFITGQGLVVDTLFKKGDKVGSTTKRKYKMELLIQGGVNLTMFIHDDNMKSGDVLYPKFVPYEEIGSRWNNEHPNIYFKDIGDLKIMYPAAEKGDEFDTTFTLKENGIDVHIVNLRNNIIDDIVWECNGLVDDAISYKRKVIKPIKYNIGMTAYSRNGSVIKQLFNAGQCEGFISDNHKYNVPYDGCTCLQVPIFFFDDEIDDGDILCNSMIMDESGVQYVKNEYPDAYFAYIGKLVLNMPATSKRMDQLQVTYLLKNDGVEVKTIHVPSGQEFVTFTPFEVGDKLAK